MCRAAVGGDVMGLSRRLIGALLAVLVAMGLAACGRQPAPQQSGELVVAVERAPSGLPVAGAETSGPDATAFDAELLSAFAESMHVRVRYVEVGDRETMLSLLRKGRVHLAAMAAGDDEGFLFTQPTRESRPVIVKHGDNPVSIDGVEDLAGREVAVAGASPILDLLREAMKAAKGGTLVPHAKTSDDALLQQVSDHKRLLVATDSMHFALTAQTAPELDVALELPGAIRFAWAFAGADAELHARAKDFLTAERRNGELARLNDRYFGHVDRINRQAIAHLVEDIQTLLPHYRKNFQDAQAATGIDWRLLAAVAYQESKWDPQATSPTGVRGIMMLTEETADRLGVSNRLDPAQSISAGSRYLASLRDLLPEDLREPDRTWHALAAYNLGLGHWNGARQIGESMKRDTRSWFEMKKVLPLMAKPEFYSRLKSGRARGGEAVIMVENIRNYYDILSRFQPAWQPVQGIGFKGAAGSAKPAAGKTGLKAGSSIGLRLPPGLAP